MKVLRTSKCNSLGHPEFRITFNPSLVPAGDDADLLIKWLEETVASGTQFQPGQTCQFGWIETEIRSHESGDYTLWEPDMQSMPASWVEGVSTTLSQLRFQKDVVESVLDPDELSFPSWRQSAIYCSRLGQAEKINLERFQPEGNASGWYFGCQEADHDHNSVPELKCASLYEIVVRTHSRIALYLALPPGVLVVETERVPEIYRDGRELKFKQGSMLAQQYRSIHENPLSQFPKSP